MSVLFVVAPAVIVSWPILCGAVAGAASMLGYKVLSAKKESVCETVEDTSAQVELEGSEVIAEAMKRDSEFAISNGDITAVFKRGVDGKCVVHVAGQGRTEDELSTIGQQILGQVTQQYAYNKVVTELKTQGFTIAQEDVSADQTIRLRVSKYV
ncbi:MAG: DUF1257 domain-containing protein [Armatimonadota bacterium]